MLANTSHPLALLALVASNLVPLLGVMLFGWDLLAILLLYWAENGVIGVFTLLKMLTAARGGIWATLPSKLFTMPFFTFHYGLFWTVHGVFIVTFFSGERLGADCVRRGNNLSCAMPEVNAFATNVLELLPLDAIIVQGWLEAGINVALLGLLISHGVSFVSNYLWQGEFLQATAFTLMFQPYGRVVILHITILVGGFLVMALGERILALLLLVILKIGVDIAVHLREHTSQPAHAADTPHD